MNMHLVTFVVGLVALTRADVSHLKHSSAPSNSLSDEVSIKFNNAGNNRYWWMNTKSSPFTKSDTHDTLRAFDQEQQQPHHTQNILHDTQNRFLNARPQQHQQQPLQQSNNIYAHMATLSGSPSEVNNLMLDTTQTNNIINRYRPVAKIPCYGATQVCAPKAVCQNGFISESDLGLVLSQSNNCDSQLEACCNIEPAEAQEDQQQLAPSPSCGEPNTACVASKFCYNGFIDQTAEHQAVRSSTGYCDAPQVCCRYSDRKRNAPSFFDNDFAAAGTGTSEVLTKEGYVVNVPSNQYLPGLPSEPEFNPDATNDDPSRLKPDQPKLPPPVLVSSTPRPQQPQPQQPQPTRQQPQPTPAPQPRPTQAPQPRPTPAPQPRPTPAPQPRPTQPPATQRPTQPPRVVQPTQPNYQPQPNQPRPNVIVQQDQSNPIVPSACAAAMNCTAVDYCTSLGVISKTPVVLTEYQKEYRVPLTDCMISATKELGKCCRDPDYTDPWPIGRLGQYNADELNAVFDSGAYKPDRQQNAASSRQVPVRVAAPQRIAPQPRPNREISNSQTQNFQARTQAPVQARTQAPTQAPVPVQPRSEQPTFQESCGVRNFNTQPRGKAPLGTGFGEFTWVAMVILESKKALLCGGTIIEKNVVITSANCVHGYRHNDVLIKAGEWRLGSDEEPKPFQIVRVQRIVFHPQFQPNTLNNDLALLYLENDIKYDTHVGPICLDDSNFAASPNDACVTTGWGKEVLKVHLGNALMQHTRVSPLPQSDCQSQLQSSPIGYTDSLVCGGTEHDACQVDPGSALACVTPSGRYTLKGVYSSETSCNEPNQIVAYTKLDLQWIRDFLRSTARAFTY